MYAINNAIKIMSSSLAGWTVVHDLLPTTCPLKAYGRRRWTPSHVPLVRIVRFEALFLFVPGAIGLRADPIRADLRASCSLLELGLHADGNSPISPGIRVRYEHIGERQPTMDRSIETYRKGLSNSLAKSPFRIYIFF